MTKAIIEVFPDIQGSIPHEQIRKGLTGIRDLFRSRSGISPNTGVLPEFVPLPLQINVIDQWGLTNKVEFVTNEGDETHGTAFLSVNHSGLDGKVNVFRQANPPNFRYEEIGSVEKGQVRDFRLSEDPNDERNVRVIHTTIPD